MGGKERRDMRKAAHEYSTDVRYKTHLISTEPTLAFGFRMLSCTSCEVISTLLIFTEEDVVTVFFTLVNISVWLFITWSLLHPKLTTDKSDMHIGTERKFTH